MSKDFSKIRTGRTGGKEGVQKKVRQSMSRKGQQSEATPEEAKERASKLKTQGRKGCKAERINMAFTPENYDFIRIMARVSGKTMTEFTNSAIDIVRVEMADTYKKARTFIDLQDEAKDILGEE